MSKKYDQYHFFRDLFRVKNTGTVQKYKNRLKLDYRPPTDTLTNGIVMNFHD